MAICRNPKSPVKASAGDADDGEGAGLRGDDGERNGPPGNIAIGKKVRPQRPLAVTKAETEPGDAQQIQDNREDVDEVKLHGTRFPRRDNVLRSMS